MEMGLIMLWILVLGVQIMNISDLIRGNWFYHSITQILVWNIISLVVLGLIVFGYEFKQRSGSANGKR